MYNLLRKSLVAVSLILMAYSCKTVGGYRFDEIQPVSYNLETLFPKGRESFVFIDLGRNRNLVNSMLEPIGLKSFEQKVIEDSDSLYLGMGSSLEDGMDIIVKGEFSKRKFDFGLFFSLSWRSKKEDGVKYWLSKDGLKLNIIDDSTIVISTDDIVSISKKLQVNHSIENIEAAFRLSIPRVSDELLINLTSGFLKGGIDNALIDMDVINSDYHATAILGVESERKAKALSRLLGIFIKLAVIGSEDIEVAEIGRDLIIEYENSNVLLKNITVSEKKLEEILNNLLVNEGEADK